MECGLNTGGTGMSKRELEFSVEDALFFNRWILKVS